MKRLLYALTAAAVVAACGLFATEPATAAGRWRLDFTPGQMGNVIVGGRAHYYMTYSLSNASGSDRMPALRIAVETETNKTYRDHTDFAVSKAAARAMRKKSLASTNTIRRTKLADGDSVDGMAQFGRIDPNADELTVKVYGLWDPVVRDKKGRVWSERRVLVCSYRRSGDEYDRPADAITLVKTSQAVEGEPRKLYGPD
jgi:hypothetical protein